MCTEFAHIFQCYNYILLILYQFKEAKQPYFLTRRHVHTFDIIDIKLNRFVEQLFVNSDGVLIFV